MTTAYGTDVLPGFTFIYPPTISSFSPVSAGTGQTVVISGSNFSGAASVSFGGVAAADFTIDSVNQITAVVGNGPADR